MIFSVLVDEWGGGHLVKGDEKEEEVPSSLGEAQAVHSQERAVRENQLDENQMLETKAEMRGAEQQKDNQEKLRKRGVEDGMKNRKSGEPKPVADEIGAKKKKRTGKHAITKTGKGKHGKKGKEKHTKKGKGKDAKKPKKQQKTGPKKKSRSQMCDNKCLEKKRLQLKAKVDKLKEHRSKIRKEIKSLNKRTFHGKELNGKETSRDTECCNDKWAAYTSLVIGLAPNVIKQVNSILTSDRTLIKKKSKQDDFLEHQRILQQALTAKPCDDGNANGKPPTPQRLLTLSFSRFT